MEAFFFLVGVGDWCGVEDDTKGILAMVAGECVIATSIEFACFVLAVDQIS